MFKDVFQGRKVLVTGHTGFKGSWLTYWLQHLGAEVCGYSLPSPTDPSHWNLLRLEIRSECSDVRDFDKLLKVFSDFQPEIVFHLAAQPLVRASYHNPIETFSTNVMGTLNVFEACRKTESVRAIVNVTSDKCYENKEMIRGYCEEDPMGGYDPYSASKGCSELLTSSYRRSYFNNEVYGRSHQTLLASCRAGNVIGGGDWAQDRLVPDVIRAASQGETVHVRNPSASRPWQHVLEPLSGYLLVGQHMLKGQVEAATGWNFGPAEDDILAVREVVEHIKNCWDKVKANFGEVSDAPHEANQLRLDCKKAREQLRWSPVWDSSAAIKKTISWYREFYENGIMMTQSDLFEYMEKVEIGEELSDEKIVYS